MQAPLFSPSVTSLGLNPAKVAEAEMGRFHKEGPHDLVVSLSISLPPSQLPLHSL